MEEKEEYKIIYSDFLVNDMDKGKDSVRKLWERIKEVSLVKIMEFEKENDLKIQVLFNKIDSNLSLYNYFPDDRETQNKCLTFVDKLNEFLIQDLKNRPLI